jgi:Flp pilus assembly protein TadD
LPKGAAGETTFRINLANALGSAAAQQRTGTSANEATAFFEAAVEEYRTVLQTEPNNVAAHRNLGLILAHLGRREEAIIHLEATLRLRPGESLATELLGELR